MSSMPNPEISQITIIFNTDAPEESEELENKESNNGRE